MCFTLFVLPPLYLEALLSKALKKMEMLPVPVKLVDAEHRSVYRQLYLTLNQRLQALGRYTKKLLSALHRTGEPLKESSEKARLFTLFREWQRTMVENGTVLNELKRYGEEFGEDFRINVNASIFGELSRIHFILHFEQLSREQTRILSKGYVPTQEDRRDMTTLYSLSSTTAQLWTSVPVPEGLDWEMPIMKYSQSKVMALVGLLCEVCNTIGSIASNEITLPYEDSATEMMELLTALMTRNAVFLTEAALMETTLDVEDMRTVAKKKGPGGEVRYRITYDYLVWCSIYFGVLMRRVYYWENLRENLMEEKPVVTAAQLERCKAFIERVARQMSSDAYEDCYLGTCEEAYDVPGDQAWFAYKFPGKQNARGNILYDLRPAVNKRYWQEPHVTLKTVMNASLMPQPRYFGHIGHLFVLNVMDSFMRARNVQWRDACVIDQDGIEMSAFKLTRAQCPLLLQVFSRYWVYDDAFYYPTDDIYEALAMWLVLLRDEYEGVLFGTPMHEAIRRVL